VCCIDAERRVKGDDDHKDPGTIAIAVSSPETIQVVVIFKVAIIRFYGSTFTCSYSAVT